MQGLYRLTDLHPMGYIIILHLHAGPHAVPRKPGVAVSHAVFHIDFSDTAHLTPDFTLSSHMQMQHPQIRALPFIS
jgi:hypothetical protein